MDITSCDNFDHLPEPIRQHNGGGDGASFRLLQRELDFGKRIDTILGKPIGVKVAPGISGYRFVLSKGNTQEIIPVNGDTVSTKMHRFACKGNQLHFEITEHIIGVLQGLHILDADIQIDVSEGGLSWPSDITGQQEYADKIYENSQETQESAEYFTVKQTVNINFGGKYNTRVSFLPVKPGEEGKCFIDVNVNYKEPVIGGKKRMIFDTSDTETFLSRIAPSRSPSYGIKRRVLNTWQPLRPIMGAIPGIPKGLERNASLQIFDNSIGNPRDIYKNLDGESGTEWMELLYHEILDKLGAVGVNFFDGKRFSGTIVFEQSSHETDIGAFSILNSQEKERFYFFEL